MAFRSWVRGFEFGLFMYVRTYVRVCMYLCESMYVCVRLKAIFMFLLLVAYRRLDGSATWQVPSACGPSTSRNQGSGFWVRPEVKN